MITADHMITAVLACEIIERIRIIVATARLDGRNVEPQHIEEVFSSYGVAPLEKCHGEAHSNPYIDNCGVCAPRWGLVDHRP